MTYCPAKILTKSLIHLAILKHFWPSLVNILSDSQDKEKMFHNEIVETDVAGEGVEDGVERRRGRQFIRWSFERRLGINNTPSVLTKFRQNISYGGPCKSWRGAAKTFEPQKEMS